MGTGRVSLDIAQVVRGQAELKYMSIHHLDLNGMHQWITVHVSWHRARTSLDEHLSICSEFAQSAAISVTVNGMHQWIIVHASWHGARTSLDERISTCNGFEQSIATSATTYLIHKRTSIKDVRGQMPWSWILLYIWTSAMNCHPHIVWVDLEWHWQQIAVGCVWMICQLARASTRKLCV